jgi:hypothetical protein
MSRFSSLIDEVADQKNHSLSDVLLKAKVLASRLRSRKFRRWIDSEINGYTRGEELPEYRVVEATLEGIFEGCFGSWKKTQLATYHLEADLRKVFDTDAIPNGISFIEDLINGEGEIGKWMDGRIVNHFRVNGTQISDMILNRVFKKVARHSFVELLNSVRSTLLDFLLELREKYPELDNDDASAVSEGDVDEVVDRRVFHNCTVIEDSVMRDSFQAGQAGAMGPNAKAEKMTFIQVLRDAIGDCSLAELAKELERLRLTMLAEAKNAEQDAAVASVAEAEVAAKSGDAKGVLGHLKNAGRWALDAATSIGTAVAAKAIEKAMGLET